MGGSNHTWGRLIENDPDAAEQWDHCDPLPDAGENPVLDAFCRRKNLSIPSLVRVGARLAEDNVLCYAYESALKYRDMNNGRQWTSIGSSFPALKIVPHGLEPTPQVIVVEGESDGARLTEAYDCDIAILPAGARTVYPKYVEQLSSYDAVLVGLDDDEAGHVGTKKLTQHIPQAVEFRPDGSGDWCETADSDLPALVSEVEIPASEIMLVPAGDLLALEIPEVASYFENDILPVTGSLVLHGWIKSFKSFIGFDMFSSLAQGREWCGFAATEEPVRVAVIQYEIPWVYYRERVAALREAAEYPDAFDENYLTYSPLVRPRLIAGNTAQEDKVLRDLTAARVEVAMFDPLRRMAGHADLNSEQDVRKILGFFERLNDNGITVVYTHHDSKGSAHTRGGEAIGMTGSGAIAGDPDTIASISLPRGQNYSSSTVRNISFTLRNAPSPGTRGMEIHETGALSYQDVPHGAEEAPADGEDTNAPPI